ncbi:hypothetical protein [Desulfobacula sp.]|uniref:hypothetical protein n=1 Tax=Desulfobacula sp. TaxID=2593537 RepID=UPI0026021F8F|nr:hypothetical protein [Desulfobacula sp.]
MKYIKTRSKEAALHVESHLKEKTAITVTISSAPIIHNALLKSNAEFSLLPDYARKNEINRKNQLWMETADNNNPFILGDMTNAVVEFSHSICQKCAHKHSPDLEIYHD